MTDLAHPLKARVHIEFDAEYAGPDDEGYHTVRCFDSRNVYVLRVPRNGTITLADTASNDPADTVRREEHDGQFVVYRKIDDDLWPWKCVDSSAAELIGNHFTDTFVDEFPRVQPNEETPTT